MVNFAQMLEDHEITKGIALNDSCLRAQRDNMKTSTDDKIEGNIHETKGTIKEALGKVIGNRGLEADGKSEKRAGKIQQKIGRAKESIAHLKGQLSETTTS